jgi:hypothetical protein
MRIYSNSGSDAIRPKAWTPVMTRAAMRACVIALLLWPLAGCGSIEVALGLRTRLDKLPVTALAASLSPGPGLAPGKSARLVITATTADGKTYVTVGPGHGKVLFDSFTFAPVVVTVNKKGKVSLPSDPRISETQAPHVLITVIGHPDISADLDIPVRYDVAFAAHFSGSAGMRGLAPTAATAAMAIMAIPASPETPSMCG